jgi:UDPglucose 6-dehydrogenase
VRSIAVIGSGVVGQATGRGFIRKGHRVTFVDINPATLQKLQNEGLDARSMDQVDWNTIDIVMLAVSTPTQAGRIILDHIEAAARDLGEQLQRLNHFVTVVVRSTVVPGTTEKRIKPILEMASGKVAGTDFGLAMNPEFLRQVSSVQDFDRPWITVIGAYDEHAARTLKALYLPFGSLTVECTPTEAEMIKYTSNLYNAVKISYFNEVHSMCEQLGISSGVVASTVARSAESMWNPLYGTRGGVPFGGACLPKDTEAFARFVHDNGLENSMLDMAIEVNERLKQRVDAAESPDQIEKMLFSQRRSDVSAGRNGKE